MEPYTDILFEQQDGIATLTLNRPQVMNALSVNLCSEALPVLEKLREERSARVLIVTGAGDKAFSAGADLKERRTMTEPQVRAHNRKIFRLVQEIEELEIPVIAAVNGFALGGGCELALACDIRIAAENASFGQTEVALGIIPGAGGTQRLPRLIGRARAKELIFTGRRIDARTAEAWGLLSRIVPAWALLDEARALGGAIAANAPLAVSGAKQAINIGVETDLRSGLALETRIQFGLYASKDWQEGLRAFNEKRKPQFTGE